MLGKFIFAGDEKLYVRGVTYGAFEPDAETYVVAPEHERSATGHAITLHKPLRAHAAVIPDAHVRAWSTNGTPADCVALGTSQWDKVDLVLSGINLGLNLGNSAWHSGTLAAAKQAVLLGTRALDPRTVPSSWRETRNELKVRCPTSNGVDIPANRAHRGFLTLRSRRASVDDASVLKYPLRGTPGRSRARSLRPAGLPAFVGQDFFLAGYRVFARLRLSDGRTLRGLRILRSDADRWSMVAGGNLLTHYNYHRCSADVDVAGDRGGRGRDPACGGEDLPRTQQCLGGHARPVAALASTSSDSTRASAEVRSTNRGEVHGPSRRPCGSGRTPRASRTASRGFPLARRTRRGP